MTQGGKPKFVFSYRVRIRNEGTQPVKLLGRHWQIRGSDGAMLAEVPKWGAGVVGQTPVLEPNAAFEYASGTDLLCPAGSVEGSLRMERCGDKSTFEAAIARFPLRAGPAEA